MATPDIRIVILNPTFTENDFGTYQIRVVFHSIRIMINNRVFSIPPKMVKMTHDDFNFFTFIRNYHIRKVIQGLNCGFNKLKFAIVWEIHQLRLTGPDI